MPQANLWHDRAPIRANRASNAQPSFRSLFLCVTSSQGLLQWTERVGHPSIIAVDSFTASRVAVRIYRWFSGSKRPSLELLHDIFSSHGFRRLIRFCHRAKQEFVIGDPNLELIVVGYYDQNNSARNSNSVAARRVAYNRSKIEIACRCQQESAKKWSVDPSAVTDLFPFLRQTAKSRYP